MFLVMPQAEAFHIQLIVVDESVRAKDLPDYKKNVRDSIEATLELKQLIADLHKQSHITANLDTLVFSRDTVTAYLYVGPQYRWVSLRKGNIDGYMLDRTGYKDRLYRDKPFRYDEYAKLEKTFIEISENNGFPFARIQLDSISISEKGIDAALNFQKGPMFTFDSILIIGKTKTKKRYLMRHLRINKGTPYAQQKIEDVDRLLQELPFLVQKRPPQILFSKNTAILTLFLEDKKINQIDGIIGFLPGEGTNKKLLVTGELNLGLRNLLGTGKSLNLEWKKIKQASQVLDVFYLHPKLLGSSIDTRINFNLLKRDSTFLTLNRKITFIQRTGRYGKVNISVGLKTSRPLDGISDTSVIKFADYNYYTYGLGYDLNTLDNIYYPRKGWLFSTLGYVGNKTIRPNPEFNPIYYEGTKLKSIQFNLESILERYTKLGRNSVLLTRASIGKIFNETKNIYFNDLYQLGGLKSLRGFNENNFYASEYAIGTIEYRFFTDETSYLLLFYEQGTLTNKINSISKFDYPLGFGAGVSFTTPAGVFNFIYSLGSSKDQKLNVNLSKVHFGITSKF